MPRPLVLSSCFALSLLACSTGSGPARTAPTADASDVSPRASAPPESLDANVDGPLPSRSAELDLDEALDSPPIPAPEGEIEESESELVTDRYAPVVTAGGQYVVISSQPADDWALGPTELVSDGSPVVVRRAVNVQALSGEVKARLGAPVRLFGDHGVVCTAKLADPALLGRTEPHFGTRQHWAGEFPDEVTGPMSTAEVAESAWELAADGRLLVARAVPIEGRCEGATWARSATLDAPAVTKVETPAPKLRARALAEFRALPRHREIQQELREHEPLAKSYWDEFDGAAPTVSIIHPANGKRALIVISATAGIGCGDFFGRLGAVFEVTDPATFPTFQLVTDSLLDGTFEPASPHAAADLDGDGKLELLVEEGWLGPMSSGATRHGLRVPFLDCPC